MLISRGCSWVSMKRGGYKFGDSKTRGCPLSKSEGCSFAVGTQPQRVSAPPLHPWVGSHLECCLRLTLGDQYAIWMDKEVSLGTSIAADGDVQTNMAQGGEASHKVMKE